MITIPVSVDITGGTAPYIFTFSSNNTNVTFSNVTGTATSLGNSYYVALTDVIYTNQVDIDTTIITCSFTDANGCSTILTPVVVNNPCTLQSTISNNGEFVFVANTTGGSGGYTYQWMYDTAIWSLQNNDNDSTDNFLSLKLKDYPTLPTSTLIAVTITDTNGCSLYKTYTYGFCKPVLTTKSVALVCDNTPNNGCTNIISQIRGVNLNDAVTLCSNQVIAWPTLEFTIPFGICLKHLGGGVVFISSSLTTAQTLNISYTVRTISGIKSEVGTIVVTTPNCIVERPSLYGVPQTIQLTIKDIVTDEKLLNVESRVAGTPDWSTFAFTNTPSWGTVTFNGNRDIVYEITNVATTPTVPDIITWSLNDFSGNQINITDTVLRNRIALPVTTSETICNTCGSVSPAFDVLANDTGSIDRSTLTLTLVDPDLTIVKDGDNNLIVTSSPGASFSNLSRYKVANIQGAFSAEQGFFTSAACAGEIRNPNKNITCDVSKTFNLLDLFVNYNAFGLVYTETTPGATTYASEGGLIVGGSGTLDFTGIAEGTYTFEVTFENIGACSPTYDDIGTATIIHGEVPHITFSSATDNGNGTSTYIWNYANLIGSYTVTLNGSPASFLVPPTGTSGTGNMTIYNVAGVNTVVIAAANICGGVATDTDNSITV
jgi:hypothetical protein